MGGQQVEVLALDGRGAGGDRTHALVHVHKGELHHLTARQAPRMLAWQAAYPVVDPRAHGTTFGINARPVGPCRVRVGDPVEVVPA